MLNQQRLVHRHQALTDSENEDVSNTSQEAAKREVEMEKSCLKDEAQCGKGTKCAS